MRRRVYLARHASHAEVGQILSGRSEIDLSDAGRCEAGRLADRLAGTPLAAIHASPRRRAIETARIVAARHALAVTEVAALDEIDFGAWSGRSFGELAGDPAWQRWNAERDEAATPAGETMTRAVARAADHLAAIAEAGPVLCVSHCDIIRGLVARYLGIGMAGIFAFDCDPASLTTLEPGDGGARLVTLNERPR